ncbi:MAG: transcriptional repressor [Candidatus Latescibacteria bacterium]|nr:transcriptional repressor [Candidatus Latescibacterota bacterium]MCK5526490.1 transcriptional repressor [Candidatus Latescibacterota bacterium]
MTERLRDKLHGEGFRLTRERQAILSFLETAKGHHDAVEIHQQLRANGHRISLATVYRTLNLFSELKAVERLSVEGQPATYEINGVDQEGRPRHYHLVCSVCGRVMDMDPGPLGASMQKLEEKLPQAYDFRATGHQLTFYGVCDRCASS